MLGLFLWIFDSVCEVSSINAALGGFCGDTEMGTRLGFLSAFPPVESRMSVRVRGVLELVFSKVLASELVGESSVLVIATGNAASKTGEALVSVVSEADPDVRSIKMATAPGASSFELRRAAAALIVSMATGSRARGVASLGVEAWLVSVS